MNPQVQRRIYVDLDDVLCESARGYLKLLDEHFGRTATMDSIHSFDLAVSFSLDPEEHTRFMELAHKDIVLEHLRALPGAKQGLERFRSAAYDVFIVTGRPAATEKATRSWLDQQRLPFQELIFVDKYGRADPNATDSQAISLDALREMEFSCAIEDSWDMAVFLAESMGLPVVLVDRPWNRTNQGATLPARLGITRCFDWLEIVRHVGDILA